MKQSRETQILYDLTYLWNLKNLNSEIENRLLVTRDRQWGDEEMLVKGLKTCSYEINFGDLMCSMVTLSNRTVLYT